MSAVLYWSVCHTGIGVRVLSSSSTCVAMCLSDCVWLPCVESGPPPLPLTPFTGPSIMGSCSERTLPHDKDSPRPLPLPTRHTALVHTHTHRDSRPTGALSLSLSLSHSHVNECCGHHYSHVSLLLEATRKEKKIKSWCYIMIFNVKILWLLLLL